MPRNGNGDYTLPQAPFVPATTISSTAVNSDLSDIASALTGSVAADGQTPITGPFKYTDGTAANPSMTFLTNQDDGFFHPAAGQVGVALAGVQGITFAAPSSSTGGGVLGPSSTVLNPIGVVQDFAGSTAPTGWFLCYGQAVSRTTYSELFAVISTTYGIGDGTTTFNLPDCRGRVGVGKDNMGGVAAGRVTTAGSSIDGLTLGSVGGLQNIAILQANLPNINFTVTDLGHLHAVPPIGGGTVGGQGGGSYNAIAAGAAINTSSATTGISVSSGGSGTALAIMQPTIIFNKIIFSGRP